MPGGIPPEVGHGDAQDDRLRHDVGTDLLTQGRSAAVQVQPVDHSLGDLLPTHKVGVRGDPLLGEEPALVCGGAVGLRGRDEELDRGGVLRGDAQREQRGSGDSKQQAAGSKRSAATVAAPCAGSRAVPPSASFRTLWGLTPSRIMANTLKQVSSLVVTP